MKKIMFNDLHGLTNAVLAGTKTQTRRIMKGVLPEIQELRVVNGVCEYKDPYIKKWYKASKRHQPKYKVGEVVAIAQSYFDIKTSANSYRPPIWDGYKEWHKYLDTLPPCGAGYNNKMLVKAELMPHKIEITNIRVERLQDISDADCLAEGIVKYTNSAYTYVEDGKQYYHRELDTPQKAYGVLINKINGLGTFTANPWVFVYDFKLAK